MTFDEMQVDYIMARRGVPALPVTGALVYSLIAGLSLIVPPASRNLTMFACFWLIMPVGALVMRLLGERVPADPTNPLFRLSVYARWMVLSTWSIHLPVWYHAPDLFPLTVGIAFGLHWVVLSWSMGSPVGLIHLAMRTALVLLAWHLFPANRVGAVAVGVAISYSMSALQLGGIHRRAQLQVQPLGQVAIRSASHLAGRR